MLKRSTPLSRRTPLRARSQPARGPLPSRPRDRPVNDPERLWKTPRWGRCENCGQIDVLPLHGHHVIERPLLRRIDPALEFDPRVRLDLCETCHMEHEKGQVNRKLPISKLREETLAFAVELLGEFQARKYLRDNYLTTECSCVEGCDPEASTSAIMDCPVHGGSV